MFHACATDVQRKMVANKSAVFAQIMKTIPKLIKRFAVTDWSVKIRW